MAPNKDYAEKDGGSDLPQKVSGPTGSPASFKPYSNPDGTTDGEAQDINGGGVKMPQESSKRLPQAGKPV